MAPGLLERRRQSSPLSTATRSVPSALIQHPLLRRCFALGGLLALAGCAENKPADARARAATTPVVVATAQRKPVPLTLDAVGTVEPMHTATVRSQVTGVLQRIAFREGDDVRAGDLLFEIDPRPFQNARGAAEAEREKFRVQLAAARQQVERYEQLSRARMVSQEQFQNILATARVLEAQVAASETAVANAQLQLDYCSIRAPLSGRTGLLGVHEGDLVRAGEAGAMLVVVTEMSPIYVTLGVPQQHLAALARHQASGAIRVSASPSGSPEVVEEGRVTFIDNVVDAANGTLRVKAAFANAQRQLWPGQFANVRLTLASPTALAVPLAAVQNGQTGQHVFIVKADGAVELRPVAIDRLQDNEAVVAQGLAEGETVVVDGQMRLTPGSRAEIRAPGAHHAPAPAKRKKAEVKAEAQ
jgi:multidrug efflux system membrane fusion protein